MKYLFSILGLFISLSGFSQNIESLELEKYQVYDEMLASQKIEKISHTYHLYSNGKRVDANCYMESFEINPDNGKVLNKIYAPYTGAIRIIQYNYESRNCFYQSSEDVYEAVEDEDEDDKYLFTRYYIYDEDCVGKKFIDEDARSNQIRRRELWLDNQGRPIDLYDFDGGKDLFTKHWNYTYPDKNSRVVKVYAPGGKLLAHQIEYFNTKDQVIKRCNIVAGGAEANCSTMTFEYDRDKITKENVYTENKQLFQQTVYTFDATKKTKKITVSKLNSDGKMEVTEEHTFEYTASNGQ